MTTSSSMNRGNTCSKRTIVSWSMCMVIVCNAENASLSSFIRHERDAEGIERTELSTPTRELQGGIRSREPSTIRVSISHHSSCWPCHFLSIFSHIFQSQSSACSDPYAPLTSTPIQDVTLTEPTATRPVPLPRRQVTVGETPILQATPSVSSLFTVHTFHENFR